jgi:DNA-directed RNA polymerase alpha subunit
MITEKQYLESVKIVNEYLLQQTTLKKIPNVLIEKVDMKYRLYNILKFNGITTLNELSTMTPNDFMKFRHFGNKTFQHLEDVMNEHKIPMGWK